MPPSYVSWEERPLETVRGSRKMQFFLRSDAGNDYLACTGVEKSARHIVFTIPDTFPYPQGHAPVRGSRFKTRRELVVWLDSLVHSSRTKTSERLPSRLSKSS